MKGLKWTRSVKKQQQMPLNCPVKLWQTIGFGGVDGESGGGGGVFGSFNDFSENRHQREVEPDEVFVFQSRPTT